MKKEDLLKLSKEELIERFTQIEWNFAESNANAAILVANIEEKNEQLKSLSNIVTNSLNEIYIFSQEDYKFLYCNRAAINNLGYSLNELMEMTPWCLKKDFDRKSFDTKLNDLLNNKKEIVSFDSMHTRKDKSQYPVEIRLQKSVFNGVPVFAAIIMDTTKEKELRDQLYHSSKLASIGQLSAGVGHEINNPLAIATGLIERLAQEESDPAKIKILEKTLKAQKRIKKIVNGLRRFARVDSEELATVNVKSTIQETLDLIGELYAKEGINIFCHKFPSTIKLVGNQNWIQQILLNLISNAKDALEKVENPSIILNAEEKEGHILISVKDNGTGIPIEVQDIVFNPFFTTKEIGKGTGLGLGISHRLANEMKGTLFFETKEGIGTTFFLKLPRATVSTQELYSTNQKTIFSNNSERVKVLIVDDEPDLREVHKMRLEDLNCVVDQAENGQVAWELISQNNYQIVFTDIKMPIMDGVALTEKIATLEQANIPRVVVITGNIFEDFPIKTQEILKRNATAILQKPVERQDIENIINQNKSSTRKAS